MDLKVFFSSTEAWRQKKYKAETCCTKLVFVPQI